MIEKLITDLLVEKDTNPNAHPRLPYKKILMISQEKKI